MTETYLNVCHSRIRLKLAGTFRTSRAIRTDKETIWVKIAHEFGDGWGEAVPIDTYHQTLESAEACLNSLKSRLGKDPFNLERMISQLLQDFPTQSASIAAIDSALHDLIGKKLGMPIFRLFGLNAEDAPLTSFSLGISDLAAIPERISAAADFPILKIKLGSNHDEETLAKVREHAPHATIRVDANMAWPVERALDMLPVLARHRVEFLEQPLPADDLTGLGMLKAQKVLPIVADESCIGPQDVLRIAPYVDGINIKLSKCGGIRQALKMIHIARAAGLKIMLGCMIESSLGISSAAQLSPLADWLDLDGHLLLAEDPFIGLGGAKGRLTLGRGPGLGVWPKTGSPD